MSTTRQLAAILFADIQGFTSLMEKDEAQAIQLREKLKAYLEQEVAKYNGRVLKFSGDGALCMFHSAIEAVHAAIALQRLMLLKPVVPLRIGIHEGDVLFEESDAYGDGVNIASRIESFAVAGGIFVSGRIYDDIKNQKDIEAISLGKYELKNVSKLVEIYAISNPGIVVPKNKQLSGKGKKSTAWRLWFFAAALLIALIAGITYWNFLSTTNVIDKSIAVLPFVDMSANRDQEYFGDGLSEELLNELAQIPDLKVIARTSSFSFKGSKVDMRVIGEKLGVAHVLEGSVRKDKNKIRITAQLIRTTDGVHLWSGTYDRDIDDIFKVQDEIAQAVVSQLVSTILDVGYKEQNSNPEAFNLMLQGKYFAAIGSIEGSLKALELFNKAYALDPGNAKISALLSNVYADLSNTSYYSTNEGYAKAKIAAERAVKLDSRLSEGYLATGRIKQKIEQDWTGAAADFDRAYELDPENGAVIHRKASLLRTLGKYDEAINLFLKLTELDPVNTKAFSSLGITYTNARRYEEAKRTFHILLELSPEYQFAHAALSSIYLFQGKPDSAMLEIKLEPDSGWKAAYLSLVNYELGNKQQAEKEFQELITNGEYDWAYQIAENYAWRGNADQAFYWLERAYEQRDGGLDEILGNPFFDTIRGDPRFKAFLKKMKLT
jgi:adenylate cyclase